MKNTFSKEIEGLKFNMGYLMKTVKWKEMEIDSMENEISRIQNEISELKLKTEKLEMLGNPNVRKRYARQCNKNGTSGWHVIEEESSGWDIFRTKNKEELEEILDRIGLEIGEIGCSSSSGNGDGWYVHYELRKKQNKKNIANTKRNVKTK